MATGFSPVDIFTLVQYGFQPIKIASKIVI